MINEKEEDKAGYNYYQQLVSGCSVTVLWVVTEVWGSWGIGGVVGVWVYSWGISWVAG